MPEPQDALGSERETRRQRSEPRPGRRPRRRCPRRRATVTSATIDGRSPVTRRATSATATAAASPGPIVAPRSRSRRRESGRCQPRLKHRGRFGDDCQRGGSVVRLEREGRRRRPFVDPVEFEGRIGRTSRAPGPRPRCGAGRPAAARASARLSHRQNDMHATVRLGGTLEVVDEAGGVHGLGVRPVVVGASAGPHRRPVGGSSGRPPCTTRRDRRPVAGMRPR